MRTLWLTVILGLFIPIFAMEQQQQQHPAKAAPENGQQLLRDYLGDYNHELKRRESRERLTNWCVSLGIGAYSGLLAWRKLNHRLADISLLKKVENTRLIPVLSGIGSVFAGLAIFGISLTALDYLRTFTKAIYCLPAWKINRRLEAMEDNMRAGIRNDVISHADIVGTKDALAADADDLRPDNAAAHARKIALLERLRQNAIEHRLHTQNPSVHPE